MGRAYKRTCVVLKRTKLKESDAILTMLSDESRQVRAVAKGVRRPGSRYGARLEPFSVVEAQLYPGRNLETLGELRCVATNAACRDDLVRLAACDCMAELLEKATRDAPADARVFALTCTALAAIGAAEPAAAPVLACAHMLKACAMMGFAPSLHVCAACGRPLEGATPGGAVPDGRAMDGAAPDGRATDGRASGGPTCYSIGAGGAVCGECAALVGGGDAIDAGVWHAVDFLLHVPFSQMSEASSMPPGPLLDFTQRWCREHLSLNVRCIDFLKSLL